VAVMVGYQGVTTNGVYYVIGNDDCDTTASAAQQVAWATVGSAALSWASTSPLPIARLHAVAAAPGNGHVYLINGYSSSDACNYGTADGKTYIATPNPDGSLGAWATNDYTPPDGFKRSIPGVATSGGIIYVAGGAINAPSWDGTVWLAEPNGDGTITAWTAATQTIPTWVGSSPIMGSFKNKLYVGGGFNAFASPKNTNHFYGAALGETGQPGAWVALTDLPSDANTQGHLVFYQVD